MKKRIGSILMTLALCLTLLPATAWAAGTDTTADVWDGTSVDTEWYDENTSATTYTLTTAAQLAGLAQLVNGRNDFSEKTITLGADIDLNGKEWTPIGKYINDIDWDPAFQGTFDGNGNTVSGLCVNINATDNTSAGLFGYVGESGTVKNLNVSGTVIVSSSSGVYVGGVVGYARVSSNEGQITVENCSFSGEVKSTCTSDGNTYVGNIYVGGVVGYARGNSGGGQVVVENCSVFGDVTGICNNGGGAYAGGVYAGGVVGYARGRSNGGQVTVENCSVSGNVTATCTGNSEPKSCVGGVVGHAEGSSNGGQVTVENCSVSGNVTVTCTKSFGSYVGGVVGRTDSANVNNCYNTGDVKNECESLVTFCDAGVGGVVGYQDDGTVENCYNTGAVTGSYDVSIGGVVGIQKKGEATNCYFDSNKNQNLNGSGSGTNVEGKNSEAFASGEVTWLLSGGETQDETSPWRQNLASYLPTGSTAADTYPTLDSTHLRVIENSSGSYTNTLEEATGEDGYYEIYSAAQLYAFASAVNSGNTTISAKLVDNIDLSTVCGEAGSWTPIGKDENHQFKGTFDGNGNTISNLTVNGNGYIGLFGFVDSGGVVKNLAVIGNVSGIGSYSVVISGMVGYNNGTVTNCSFSGTVSCGENGGWMGGVVGYNNNGTVTNCSFSGTVSGGTKSSYIGGVVGNNLGTVKYCSNTGTVSGGEDSYVIGGVVGSNSSNGAVESCYNTGDVSGGGHSQSQIGGVVGYNASQVTNCYNTGNVSGERPMGGVVGCNSGGTMSNCYYLKSDVVNAGLNGTDGSTDIATKVESKNSIAFASGEVAYLLQNGQEGTVWVQIEDENGTLYPTLYALLSEEEHAQIRAVYVVTFQVEDASSEGFPVDKYAVEGGTVAEIPAAPEGATWCVGNEEFTTSTVVTGNLTVTAKTCQTAPAAPTLASRTTTSITLKEVAANDNNAAAQYGISTDGTTWTWQASPAFTDLASDTEYTFALRYGATESCAPSPVSETAKFSTDKPSVVDPVVPVTPPAVVTPTYPPAVEGADNGTVSVTPANPRKGSTVTVTPKPETGYEVDSITVTDKNGNPVQVTDNGDGTYSFTQPASKVTVAVTFTETKQPAPDLPFTDVDPTAWYAEAVSYMLERGLMTGTAPDTFSPNSTTTRAMIVTILYRLEGAPGTNGDTAFTDVERGTWYTDPITWAAANGVVEGTTPTTFAPNSPVTREQMATILYRYLAAKGYDVTARADLSGYTDAEKISAYAKDAMSWANALGLITGERPDTLTPQGNATRAQVAEILMRYCIAMEQ